MKSVASNRIIQSMIPPAKIQWKKELFLLFRDIGPYEQLTIISVSRRQVGVYAEVYAQERNQ